MTAGAPRTWATNDYITATRMNAEIRDQLLVKTNGPRCYLWKSVKIAMPISGGLTDTILGWSRDVFAVHLDQVLYDISFDGTKMALGDGRIFVNRPGLYRFNGMMTWGAERSIVNPTTPTTSPDIGTRAVWVGKNMNGNFCSTPGAAGIDPAFAANTDYIEAIHSSASSIDTLPAASLITGSMRAVSGDHFQLFWRPDGISMDCIPSQGTCFLQARWESS